MDKNLLLIVQISINVLLYMLFIRRLSLPKIIILCLMVIYTTIPIFILAKSMASAIYLSDICFFILIIYIVRHNKLLIILNDIYCKILFALLILLPLLTTLFLVLLDNIETDQIFFTGHGLWFYRNLTYLILFGIGITFHSNNDKIIDFIKANVILGTAFGIFGIINYYTSVDLSVFEFISKSASDELIESLTGTRIGAGFMGVFKTTIGQWFATLGIISLTGAVLLKSYYRFLCIFCLAVCTVVIMSSLSRAGLIGLLLGIILAMFFIITGKYIKITLILLVVTMGAIALNNEIISNRYKELITASEVITQDAVESRTSAWKISLNYFPNNLDSLLLGVGPANTFKTNEITGVYGAHNEYVDVIFREGILGLFLLLFTIYRFFIGMAKVPVRDHYRSIISNSMLIILTVNCVIALTQSHLISDYATHVLMCNNYLMYGVFIGFNHIDNQCI